MDGRARAVPPEAGVALAVVVALGVNVAWGATPVLTTLAVEDLEPIFVAVARTVLAAAVALPLLAGLRIGIPATAPARWLLVVSGLTGFVAAPILLTLGQARTSATHAVMILAAIPVFTGAYAALVERRRPSRAWFLGCAIALAGEALLVGSREGAAGGAEPTLAGDLLMLAAGLVVALGYVAGALLSQGGYRSTATTLWGVSLAGIVLAPAAGGLLGDGIPEADAAAWASVLFLALVTSIVCYFGWYWALGHGGIARIGTIQFVQPFSGLILAALVLGERLTAPLAASAAAVLVGVWIAQGPRQRRTKSP